MYRMLYFLDNNNVDVLFLSGDFGKVVKDLIVVSGIFICVIVIWIKELFDCE